MDVHLPTPPQRITDKERVSIAWVIRDAVMKYGEGGIRRALIEADLVDCMVPSPASSSTAGRFPSPLPYV